MDMTSTRIVNAPPIAVWEALNDPAVLRDSIPGCQAFERTSDTEWRTVVASKVGPVSATFTGKITLADVNPPTSYTLRFEGQGGVAGFANGEAKVSLGPADGGATALTYTAKAQVGGKIAQLGSRLIDGAAAKMADEFFARFTERFAPTPPTPTTSPQMPFSTEGPPAGASKGYPRYIALIAIAAILAWLALKGFRW